MKALLYISPGIDVRKFSLAVGATTYIGFEVIFVLSAGSAAGGTKVGIVAQTRVIILATIRQIPITEFATCVNNYIVNSTHWLT